MCKSMEDYRIKNEVNGAIKLMKRQGASENDIVKEMMEMFHVTKEYVLALLVPRNA